MTRKRFIKLAMSVGMDRKHAELLAATEIIITGYYSNPKEWDFFRRIIV